MRLDMVAVIRRNMRLTTHFLDGLVPPGWRVEHDAGELLVGSYDFPASSRLVFTNEALYFARESLSHVRLSWEAIESYDLPDSKFDAHQVTFRTVEGDTFTAILAGSHGRYDDAWNFVQLLHTLLALRGG